MKRRAKETKEERYHLLIVEISISDGVLNTEASIISPKSATVNASVMTSVKKKGI